MLFGLAWALEAIRSNMSLHHIRQCHMLTGRGDTVFTFGHSSHGHGFVTGHSFAYSPFSLAFSHHLIIRTKQLHTSAADQKQKSFSWQSVNSDLFCCLLQFIHTGVSQLVLFTFQSDTDRNRISISCDVDSLKRKEQNFSRRKHGIQHATSSLLAQCKMQRTILQRHQQHMIAPIKLYGFMIHTILMKDTSQICGLVVPWDSYRQ